MNNYKKPKVIDKLHSRHFPSDEHVDKKIHYLPSSSDSCDKNSEFSEDLSDDDSFVKQDYPSDNIRKLFPPPNPLPPKAFMYLNEPVRLGANAPLLYSLDDPH